MIDRVVFDCNIFAQALLTPEGSAGRCMAHVLEGRLSLFWSAYVVSEVRGMAEKETPRRLGVTSGHIEVLLAKLAPLARKIDHPPSVFVHPIDPKDSHHVNLAVSADAKLIVSRDKHLLNLTNAAKPPAKEFMARFPGLEVLPPERLLEQLGLPLRWGCL
jgi:putative PIN family toxin of toxin-antitoxin system